MSARYPALDDVRVIDDGLATGLEPWTPGDCFVVMGREMLYVSLRVRIDRAAIEDPRLVLRPWVLPSDIRPRSQTIRSGFIGRDLVRFDWNASSAGLTIVGTETDLTASTQITLDFMARRAA